MQNVCSPTYSCVYACGGEEVIFDTRPACVDRSQFISLASPARSRPMEIASFFSNFASLSRPALTYGP